MDQSSINNLNIEEGTVNFWIRENSLNFSNNQAITIGQIDPPGGSILIVKDVDNMLKVFYVVLGKGRVDIEADVSDLEQGERHMITFTWGLNKKELALFVDAKLKQKKEIIF